MIDRETFTKLGLDESRIDALVAAAAGADAVQRWQALAGMLRPSDPFEAHQALFRANYADWDAATAGPPPVAVPTDAQVAAANVTPHGGIEAVHRASVSDPEGFWSAMLERLHIAFDREPERILDDSGGPEHPRWLPGARLNIAASVFTGDPERPAVVVQRPGEAVEVKSLATLKTDTQAVMAGLSAMGIEPGDAVAIDMPMAYWSVPLYLGIVAAGAVVVSIADSFAAGEIATRLRISEAKAIVTQDVIVRGAKTLPLYARVRDAEAPPAVVLPAGDELVVDLREGDRSWQAFLEAGRAHEAAIVICDADAPSNILFSSGTTGDPKAIVWSHTTPIKGATDGWAHHDIRAGDVVAWPTNLGWMMGPWLVYASLLNHAAIALYEGAPHGPDFGRFVEEAGVTMLGVVPSLVKAWRTSEALEGIDWSSIRAFSSTGEASNAEDMHWLSSRAGYRPVVEYCGGTEIGGGYILGSVVQPQAAACFSTPAVGCAFFILDEEGHPTDNGELALVPPMLGSSQGLLNRDHHEVYFEGMPTGPEGQVLRRHGDQMERLPGGYYRAHGRVDDTMNLGGIKTSSAEIERVLLRLDGVVETAAIAVPPPGGGPSQLVIVARVEGAEDPDALRTAFQQAIRSELNPLFKVSAVRVVDSLPRTASGKVMRRVLRREHSPD